MTTYYETMNDAEQALSAILAEADITLGDRAVADAYDLDGLGDEVIIGGPASPNRYALLEDKDAFWAAVERHAR